MAKKHKALNSAKRTYPARTPLASQAFSLTDTDGKSVVIVADDPIDPNGLYAVVIHTATGLERLKTMCEMALARRKRKDET